ncbi:MAG: FeoB-associated Cys-rich membrane protein [Treponema sp.]|jgi:hypothetical protein|nr:FeoB-associated Cys-rich membrane protein [Treponema sp.]
MDFIRENMSTIIVSVIVFCILGVVLFRLINNFRKGKTGCSCGCCDTKAECPKGV